MNYNEVEILLVEDSVADAELTIRALKKANVANKLVHVQDGAEALDFIFCRGIFFERDPANKPKVILLDIKMPRVDGMEVLRHLKSVDDTRRIPVVILTSSNEDSDLVASYNLGANSYVVKPVGFEGFAKAVNDLGLYWILRNRAIP